MPVRLNVTNMFDIAAVVLAVAVPAVGVPEHAETPLAVTGTLAEGFYLYKVTTSDDVVSGRIILTR